MKRIGYSRREDIPENVMIALNEGRDESKTLSEWLAIDHHALLDKVIESTHFKMAKSELRGAQEKIRHLGIMDRLRTIGTAIYRSGLCEQSEFELLSTHPSNAVREWSAMAIGAIEDIDFGTRLARLQPFANDHNMSVRECAWFAWRPHFEQDMTAALPHLMNWSRDPNENLRRCAIEGSRPRGVWARHIRSLKVDPTPCLDLLETCRADPSTYVQKAVANWLNDASKSRPEWVAATCKRWLHQSQAKETKLIVKRALRTLRKTNPEGIVFEHD